MIKKVAVGVVLLVLAGMHHRFWWVLYRTRRWREGDELASGKVRDVNDFMLKWRGTVILLLLGWLFLASASW